MTAYRIGLAKLLLLCSFGAANADLAECVADEDETARARAEQTVLLLERLVTDSSRVQQVIESGRAEALANLEAAGAAVTGTHEFLVKGCNASAATLATDGLSQVSRAFQLAREQVSAGATAFEALGQRTESFLAALESQPADLRGVSADDLVGMQRQISRAKTMAVNGNYSGASALLAPVFDRLERRLFAIFDQRTIYYERDFATVQDEYNYLAEQYRGYELLLDQIASQETLPYSTRAGYDQARQQAAQLNEQAAQQAGAGAWQAAVAAANEALRNNERALQLIGVNY